MTSKGLVLTLTCRSWKSSYSIPHCNGDSSLVQRWFWKKNIDEKGMPRKPPNFHVLQETLACNNFYLFFEATIHPPGRNLYGKRYGDINLKWWWIVERDTINNLIQVQVCVRFVYISDFFRVNVNTVHMIILAHLGRFDDIFMSCAMCWGGLGEFPKILSGQIHDVQVLHTLTTSVHSANSWTAGF